MSNENLIKAIKAQKESIIFAEIFAISTVLVGMRLFDKNNTLGKAGFIAGTMGFVLIAFTSLFFVLNAVKEVSSKLKEINHQDLRDNLIGDKRDDY